MDVRRAVEDVAEFLSRGGVSATDPQAERKAEDGFGPTRRLLTAVMAAAVAVAALAGPAAAGPAPRPDDVVHSYIVNEEDQIAQIDAADARTCVRKANTAVARLADYTVTCFNARTEEPVAILGLKGGKFRVVYEASQEASHSDRFPKP